MTPAAKEVWLAVDANGILSGSCDGGETDARVTAKALDESVPQWGPHRVQKYVVADRVEIDEHAGARRSGEEIHVTTIPLNWHVKIVCRDCGSIYDVQRSRVDCSVDRLPAGQRMLLLTVPNECPDCHNLHVVPKENT